MRYITFLVGFVYHCISGTFAQARCLYHIFTKQTTDWLNGVTQTGGKRADQDGISYRFAYLLLPLEHVRHWVVARELHVAVEHDTLAQYGGDVDSILVTAR